MRIYDIINETTTTGAIATGAIASVVGTIGDQRELHRSIYSTAKSKAKSKSLMIRRQRDNTSTFRKI